MSGHTEAAAEIEAFSDRDVAPLVFDVVEPLRAGVYQTKDPVPFAVAENATFRSIEPGWRWGPVWSNAWFRLSGTAPKRTAGVVCGCGSRAEQRQP
jgi:alpha-mannosidase